MNHFIFPYAGNKRDEMKFILPEIKELLDSDKIKYIIEPYCGSSAFSYFISLLYPQKFTYVLNDNNEYLIELYDIMGDDDKLMKFNKKIDEIMEGLDKKKYKELPKDIYRYYIHNKIYTRCAGLYPLGGHNTKYGHYHIMNLSCPVIEFVRNENIMFFNESGIDIYKTYKCRDDCLIFLDPPYLLNTTMKEYKDTNMDIYPYLFYNDFTKENATILLCVEKMWIIEAIFCPPRTRARYKTYDKIYQKSKKKTTHILLKNR